MKQFLYDMHVHTAESSSCAHACAKDVVAYYKSLGYRGIVITDHMNTYKMKKKSLTTIEEKADYLLKGYREAKKYENPDFTVLLGMELEFADIESDFLIYGLDEALLYRYHFDLFRNLEEFRPVADEHNLLIFQAHPFRFDMTVQDPALLDGMEVYNGNPGHHSNNDIAAIWAEKYGLRKTSGSDFHGDITNAPTGGILFKRPVNDEKQLVKELRSRDYHLKDE